jgi:hypothetical protein
LTDATDFLFYGEGIKTGEREAKQNANSSVEHQESVTERSLDLFRCAIDRCRVWNAPVRGRRLPRPNRTDFLGGIITNRENEIHTWCCGSREFFPWFAAQFRSGEFSEFQLSECAGMYAPFGRLPALYAVKFAAPLRFMMASAMMERAEFPVHKNKTL